MNFILIGSIIGIVLAVSGAGGGLISIPLLVHIAGLSLRDASVLSLPIVAASSLISIAFVLRDVRWHTVGLIFLSSLPSAFAMSQIKSGVPEWVIQCVLVSIAAWGLYTTWLKKQTVTPRSAPGKRTPLIPIGIGILAGGLTALTGMGGGVILFPALRQWLGLTDEPATATSLGIILLNTFVSYVFQLKLAEKTPVSAYQIALLLGGVVASILLTRYLKRTLSDRAHQLMVKTVFTLVLLVSIILIFAA